MNQWLQQAVAARVNASECCVFPALAGLQLETTSMPLLPGFD